MTTEENDYRQALSPGPDQRHRFSFDGSNVRGQLVQLEQTVIEALARHHYPPAVEALLGEFLAAAALLSGTIKWRGRMVLQTRGSGELPLIMAEADSDGALRAIARGAGSATATGFRQLVGEGQLAITIEPEQGESYQGLVTLEGPSLANCLMDYFQRSEQLATGIWLAAEPRRAAGLLLQELPPRPGETRAFETLSALAATVRDDELQELPAQTLLYRLFNEFPPRLLQSSPLRFACSCSRERSERTLMLLGAAEVESLIAEHGLVEMNCEFCGRQYQFDSAATEALFRPRH